MTRIAIVAASEELRTRLATALGADPAFEIVTVSASVDDVAPSAEVVLVARTSTVSSTIVRRTAGDGMGETVLTNGERDSRASG